jgi:quinone-modifying oxidoreductase subunit QmoC
MHHSAPRIIGNWVNNPKLFPLMFVVIPVVLLAAALLVRGPLEQVLPLGEPHGALYADFFPHWLLIAFYSSFTGLAFFGCLVGLARFWMAMTAADSAAGLRPVQGVIPSVVNALKSIMVHDRFGKCGAQAGRRWSHLLAFYGFIALFIVTVWATIDLYLMPLFGVHSLYPFGLLHPMKILANIGGVFLVVGCVKAIVDRRGDEEGSSANTSFDWTFVWLLLLVGVTGFVTEALRFMIDAADRGAAANVAYAIYFVHLILVFGLLVYLPYSKFAHLWYRTVALIYAEHTGRNNGKAVVKA